MMLASAAPSAAKPPAAFAPNRVVGLSYAATETTTVTLTTTPTDTATGTATPTMTGTPTETETPTETPTSTETSTPTATPSPTDTLTPTPTPIPEICTLVYADNNGSSERDPGEGLVAGARITITTISRIVIDTHLTDGKGEPWCRGGLSLDTYIVREEDPPGYESTTANVWVVFFPPGRREEIAFGDRLIPTATSTPTMTDTTTATATTIPTGTATPTYPATATATDTATPTETGSPTDTATSTPSPSPSPTGTLLPTATATPTATSTPLSCIDAYEPDDQWWQAKPIAVNGDPQGHNIHQPGDVDWVKFGALGQVRYTIFTDQLSPRMDTYLCLYDTDGQTGLLCNDEDPFNPGASRIRWFSPAPGTYFVMIRHFDPTSGGCDRTYQVVVTGLVPRPSPTPGTYFLSLPLVIKRQ